MLSLDAAGIDLREAANLWLAQLASLGAVVIEGWFVLNILASGWAMRLVFGIAGVALLASFLWPA